MGEPIIARIDSNQNNFGICSRMLGDINNLTSFSYPEKAPPAIKADGGGSFFSCIIWLPE